MTLAASSAKRHTQRYRGVLLCDGLRFRSLVLAEENITLMPAIVSVLRRLTITVHQHQRTDDWYDAGESILGDLSSLEWNSRPYERSCERADLTECVLHYPLFPIASDCFSNTWARKKKQLQVSKHSYVSGIWAWIVDVWPLCGVFERDCGVLAGDTTIGANARMALATC